MLVIGRPCRLRKINDAAGIGNELGGVARSIVVETNVRRSGNAGEGTAARKRMDGSRACPGGSAEVDRPEVIDQGSAGCTIVIEREFAEVDYVNRAGNHGNAAVCESQVGDASDIKIVLTSSGAE